ncbi:MULTISPECIES: hypothetical protein [Xanthomonas]|uniref:hypothetical protein n=1 Tax=Xanthomonas TaxID=338 RepID=UPI000B2C2FFA|nr:MULTISPECIES: hypothetical protein [Xanthomonas]
MITDEIKIRTAFVLNVLSKSEMPVCFFRFNESKINSDSVFLHKLSVSIIHFCLAANLVKFAPSDWLEINEIGTLEEYVNLLGSINPESESESDCINWHDYAAKLIVWMDAQIECTPLGDELISFYFANESDIQNINAVREFWDRLVCIFNDNGFFLEKI